jgi:hypothetical protein
VDARTKNFVRELDRRGIQVKQIRRKELVMLIVGLSLLARAIHRFDSAICETAIPLEIPCVYVAWELVSSAKFKRSSSFNEDDAQPDSELVK